jgi:hypothetical protein
MKNLNIYFLIIIFINISYGNSQILKQNLLNKKESKFMDNNIPIISTRKDIKIHDDKIVYLTGIYKQTDVRMRQKNPDILYKGHVAIYIGDGTEIFLYPPYKEEAIRDRDEIEKFENKLVLIKAKISSLIPYPDTSPKVLSMLLAPCIVDLISIELKNNFVSIF